MEYNLVHFKDDGFEIDVNIDKDTIWLTQQQLCELFERDRTVITRHINNIFKEMELDEKKQRAKNALSKFWQTSYAIKHSIYIEEFINEIEKEGIQVIQLPVEIA